jgi:hypothetical protein
MRKYILVTIVAAALVGGYLTVLSRAENQTPSQEMWGNPYNGVAISVSPTKSGYKLGEKIEVQVAIKNFGEEDARLLVENGEFGNYRLALYYPDGRPVAMSKQAEEAGFWGAPPQLETIRFKEPKKLDSSDKGSQPAAEAAPKADEPPLVTLRRMILVQPGKTAPQPETLTLDRWFKIDSEGTYLLVAMRRLTSWQHGFAISNAVRIQVTR